MIRIFDVVMSLDEGEGNLPLRAAELLGIEREDIASLRVVRRSLDARRERPPRFVYIVDVSIANEEALIGAVKEGLKIRRVEDTTRVLHVRRRSGLPAKRPVVIGSGPAGLFAALTLAGQGVPVLILERGKRVEERVADTEDLWRDGRLNTESNVHFGEGGAGTFSDGKLTTRLRGEKIDDVKRIFVDMGAPLDILTDGKPHVGTDRLRGVVMNLRQRLIDLGCEIRFNEKVTDFLFHRGRMTGIVVRGREEIKTNHLILAVGQSAVETYEKLFERGVTLAPKPFAMGLRVEHPQEMINRIQYGRWWPHRELPSADYFMTAKVAKGKRTVYVFCMCPGGEVIGCASDENEVVTNGMSSYRRGSLYANSALVVNVRTDDFAAGSPLSGIAFRKQWEQKAFCLGGRDYRAPAQRLTDFVVGKESRDLGHTSFRPGVTIASLKETLPGFVYEALREGVRIFDRKMPGFLTSEASLIGVETRTSSPVRILREEDGQAMTVRGLYPCGEGSGYAGGIMSSALDGIRAAEHLLRTLET